MVTGSKKPEAAPKAKAPTAKSATTSKSAKPKATVKAKATTTTKSAAKPKTTTKAKATTTKSVAKPKTTTKAKTTTKKTAAVKVVEARKVGEMVYNDELLEALAEMVLRGSASDLTAALPEIKRQLFDYDIYMVSFLSDDEVGAIAENLADTAKVDAKDLTDRLLAVRESARVFVNIAGKHNSVRAYIDRAIEADGGVTSVKEAFLAGEYCIVNVDSAVCESFLTLF